jgi:hypothetical protein
MVMVARIIILATAASGQEADITARLLGQKNILNSLCQPALGIREGPLKDRMLALSLFQMSFVTLSLQPTDGPRGHWPVPADYNLAAQRVTEAREIVTEARKYAEDATRLCEDGLRTDIETLIRDFEARISAQNLVSAIRLERLP